MEITIFFQKVLYTVLWINDYKKIADFSKLKNKN